MHFIFYFCGIFFLNGREILPTPGNSVRLLYFWHTVMPPANRKKLLPFKQENLQKNEIDRHETDAKEF